MMLNRGELDGIRLLGNRTVDYMTRNHLPGNVDLEHFGRPNFAETSYQGVGFGLGFAVVLDAAANKVMRSEGEYSWGSRSRQAQDALAGRVEESVGVVEPVEMMVCFQTDEAVQLRPRPDRP